MNINTTDNSIVMTLVFNTEHIQEVYAVESLMRHHTIGRGWTVSGYGKKIPTRYKVGYNNKWYRVYSDVFSNSGSCYIIHKGSRITVR